MGNPERLLRFGHIWIMCHDDDIEMLQMTHSFEKIQQIFLPPTNGVGNVMLSVVSVCLSVSQYFCPQGPALPLYRIQALTAPPPPQDPSPNLWTCSSFQLGPHCTDPPSRISLKRVRMVNEWHHTALIWAKRLHLLECYVFILICIYNADAYLMRENIWYNQIV